MSSQTARLNQNHGLTDDCLRAFEAQDAVARKVNRRIGIVERVLNGEREKEEAVAA